LLYVLLGFVMANRLEKLGVETCVVCDILDEVTLFLKSYFNELINCRIQAKGEQVTIDGVQYQRSLRSTGKLFQFMGSYEELLDYFSQRFGVK
jgi:hypothetical protein